MHLTTFKISTQAIVNSELEIISFGYEADKLAPSACDIAKPLLQAQMHFLAFRGGIGINVHTVWFGSKQQNA